MANHYDWDCARCNKHCRDCTCPRYVAQGYKPDTEQELLDNTSVDRFAERMKEKLQRSRDKGRGGWETDECTESLLSRMLKEHIEKGDPVDVANFCMFLWSKGFKII